MSEPIPTRVRPLRLGMIGGGTDAFIGAVHRMAAALDGRYEFVCGALSSTSVKAVASGLSLGLPLDRAYGSWRELLERECALPPERRVQVITIVTPNATHAAIALACVRAGFHVMLDKPMVTSMDGARELLLAVDRAGTVFAVTYNYTGYPMVRHARELVAGGALGVVRRVYVEYHQGWLATNLESGLGSAGHKQAAWRTDPSASGAGAIADIGSHAENLVSFVTGLGIDSVSAELTSFVHGRRVDDDAGVQIRFSPRGGLAARGVLTASQVCVGEKNNLTLRVHGERGSLWWEQETPDTLRVATIDSGTRLLSRGEIPCGGSPRATRLPAGHPEGFLAAFANLYLDVADAIASRGALGTNPPTHDPANLQGFPDVRDGARGVAFIDACQRSAAAGSVWTTPERF